MSAQDLDVERRLAEVRAGVQPALADKERILANVRAAVTAGLPAGAPLPGARAAALSGRLAYALGAGAMFGLLGLAGGFGLGQRAGSSGVELPNATAARNSQPEAAPLVIERPVPHVLEQRAAEPPSLVTAKAAKPVKPVKPVKRDAALRSAPRATATPDDGPAASRGARAQPLFTLSDGLELLAQAERALHANDPALALALLGDLDRRAPRSMLRQERLTTQVLASCAARDASGGRDAREELQREFPNSIYARRLERACNDIVPAEPRARLPFSNSVPANLERPGH